MALFRVANERAQFDAAGLEASDVYGAGIRFTQGGNARVTTSAGTFFNQGVPMSGTGQVAIVDATAGLPAGTIFHNGLPMSGDKVCVSKNATAVVSNGLPFDSAGALASDINFDLNFVNATSLNSSVTFTRASTGTFFNSSGVLTSAAINAPRFDYDPTTLAARGLLIEEQRTNSIRNNTMQGAVAGTPGTLPTNWAIGGTTTGLTISVVGTGTESGITYIDIRFNGTAGAALNPNILFDTSTGIAAANGQTWAWSSYVSVVGGSLTNVTNILAVQSMFSSVPALLGTLSGSPFVPTGAALNTQRQTFVGTLNQATTAFVRPQLQFSVANGAAIDITLRIGLPQLELGAFATSVIPTTTTALTRSADVASVNTLAPWYRADEGTLFAQANVISSSYTQGVLVDLGAGGAFGTTEYVNWSGTGWILNPNTPPINVSSSIATTSTAKVAAGLKTNDSVISANGLLGAVDTSCGIVVAPTTLSIGKAGWAAGNYFNGWIQRITYYPRRLSNAELQSITTP